MATCPTCRARYDDATAVCANDGAKLLPDEAFSGVDADLAPGTQVGEYRIEEKLGAGGFGTVYRAQHPVIGKAAAVKVLAREFSSKPEIVARFIDEARAVNQIRHKGIIDIFAFGSLPDGRHYFVMELLEGLPLDAYLRQRGRIPPGETIAILRGVARAVDAAHHSGIAHRDLKPDNVFLVIDPDGTVHTKLLDFGVAKLLSERSGRTATGTPIGTPAYMSPEQSRGVNVDTRTDVYSFGVMAFEMLTGRVPFVGATVMDTLMKQIADAPPTPSSVCAELPPELDAPILCMLEKEPEKRPRTLSEAADALAAAAEARGIPVAPVSAVSATPSMHAAAVARTVPISATPAMTPAAQSPAPPSLIGSSAEVSRPRRRPHPLFFLAPIAVVATVASGATVLFLRRSAPPGATALATPSVAPIASAIPTAPPPSAPVSARPSATAPAPSEVSITLDTTPAHAAVYDGQNKLGDAPGPIRLARGDGKRKLTIRAPGYLARDVDVGTEENAIVQVRLSRATAAAHATTPKPGLPSELEKAY